MFTRASEKTENDVALPRYHFIVGVSLSALEQEVNRIVSDSPGLKLIQVLHAAGTGFIAVLEGHKSEIIGRTEPEAAPEDSKRKGSIASITRKQRDSGK